MNISAWIPKIQVIPLRDTRPCGFAAQGIAAVEAIYCEEKSRIMDAILEACGNGYGYVPKGLSFLLTREEWEAYGKKTDAPAYETGKGVYVVFRAGVMPREWKPWACQDWFVPYEGAGIVQLRKGKAVDLPPDFLPREAGDYSGFDHDIDWIVRKAFEAGKKRDKSAYAGLLSAVGQEWDLLMQQAWKAGSLRMA